MRGLGIVAAVVLAASSASAAGDKLHPTPPPRPGAAAALAAAPVEAPAAVAVETPGLIRFLTGLSRPVEPLQPAPAPAVAVVPAEPLGRRGARLVEPGAGLYRPLIAKHAAAHGIPAALADAVVRVESRYNTLARNGPNLGLTQINYRTALAIGYNGTAAGLLDADTNLRFGIKYLAMAYRLAGGDTCRTIMKYQGGHRAVSMSRANSVYCARVRTMMAGYGQ